MGRQRRTARIRHQHDAPRIPGLRERMIADDMDALVVEKVFQDLGQLADYDFLASLAVRGLKRGIETIGRLAGLQELALWEIRDLSTAWMEGMSQLIELSCYGVKFKSFVLPARPNQLEQLRLTNCTGFGGVLDISPLDKLTHLTLDACGQIRALSDCSGLTDLRCVSLTNIRDLNSLEMVARAPNLNSVVVQQTPNLKVSDLEWMLHHPTLEEVYPALNPVRGDPVLDEVQKLLGPRFGDNLFGVGQLAIDDLP